MASDDELDIPPQAVPQAVLVLLALFAMIGLSGISGGQWSEWGYEWGQTLERWYLWGTLAGMAAASLALLIRFGLDRFAQLLFVLSTVGGLFGIIAFLAVITAPAPGFVWVFLFGAIYVGCVLLTYSAT